MFNALDISSSALTAQRVRLDTIAGNIANMNTSRSARNPAEPYRRRFVVFSPGHPSNPRLPGVSVAKVEEDHTTPFRPVFEPWNPDSDKNGYVRYPNVDLAIESINALEASRAYEANVTVMEVSKSMFNSSLRLLA
jgi:flagellar basal-body rod protein FlgC